MTRLTFQVTHATDSDTNVERDYIMDELRNNGMVGDVTVYDARQTLPVARVNHYVTDGEVAVASLVAAGAG